MEFRFASFVATIAAIAFMVDPSVAFGYLNGLGFLQNYYEAAAPAAALPPAPAPAMPFAMPPMFCAPPPPPPPMALPAPIPLPAPQAPCCPGCCEKGCSHPSCLSFIKPCIHAKLLNLKKKLIEKKLTHLLACCAHYNSHLGHPPC